MTETLKPRSFVTLFIRRGGFWLLFFIVVAALTGMMSYGSAKSTSDFAARSVSTTAELISKEVKRTRRSAGSLDSAIPHGIVRFMVDGEEIFASARISQDYYDSLEKGEQITVRYLPENPRTIELEFGINLNQALIVGSVTVLALGAWCFVIWRAFQFARNAPYVRKHGTRTLVPVAEYRAPVFINNKKPTTRLVWKDSGGQEGLSLDLSVEEAKAHRVGREIAIYELPGSGRASRWEGDVGHA